MARRLVTDHESLIGLAYLVRCVGGSYHNKIVRLCRMEPYLEVCLYDGGPIVNYSDWKVPPVPVVDYQLEVYELVGVRLPTGAPFYEYHLKGECEEWLLSGVVDAFYEPPKTTWKLRRYLQANWFRIEAGRLKR